MKDRLTDEARTKVQRHYAKLYPDVSHEDIDRFMVDSIEGHLVALQMQLDEFPWPLNLLWRNALAKLEVAR